jgi:hypothetical protein
LLDLRSEVQRLLDHHESPIVALHSTFVL